MQEKFKCQECGHVFLKDEMLIAKSPFHADDMISGCPKCKTAEQNRPACAWDDCLDFGTCGQMVGDKYHFLCHTHSQMAQIKNF